MSFFEEVDSLELVENHIEQLQRLEQTHADKLLRIYKQVRLQLRDRLDVISGDTFTAQQMRATLVQVEAGIQAMSSGLLKGLEESSGIASDKAIKDLTKEIERFSSHFEGAATPINIDNAVIALDVSNFLVNQKEASIRAYSEDVRAKVVMNLTKSMIANESTSEVIQKVGKFFIGEEWKLRRIARTELHNVYNLGKLKGMERVKEDTIPDLKKTLIHPMDNRTGDDSIELAEQNPIIPIDKPFVQKFRGETFSFMAPPNRPNDRAILVPVRDEWVR